VLLHFIDRVLNTVVRIIIVYSFHKTNYFELYFGYNEMMNSNHQGRLIHGGEYDADACCVMENTGGFLKVSFASVGSIIGQQLLMLTSVHCHKSDTR